MPDNYFARYLPLLIHLLFAFGLAGAIVILSQLVGRHRYSRAKFQPYECGMAPTGDARERFSVKFYMVAMLFILFDIEVAFLYPWAVIYRDATRTSSALAWFVFGEMLLFILLLAVGYIYVWKKRAFDWK